MIDLVPDGRKTGWLIDQEDSAWIESLDVGVPFTFGDYKPIQETLKKPSEWLRVEDQNGFGSCQGATLSSVGEVAYYNATKGEIIQLSKWFAYVGTQLLDGIRGDQGSTISGGAKLAEKYGLCPESDYPYPDRYTQRITDYQYQAAEKYKLKKFVRMQSVDDVYKWLDAGLGAISFGVRWGNGGHAVAGIQRNPGSGIRLINSWGTHWGDNGFFDWTERELAGYLRDNYTEAIGMTDMSEVKPREYEWDIFA